MLPHCTESYAKSRNNKKSEESLAKHSTLNLCETFNTSKSVIWLINNEGLNTGRREAGLKFHS